MVSLPFSLNIAPALYTTAFIGLSVILFGAIIGYIAFRVYDKKVYVTPVWIWEFPANGQPKVKMTYKMGNVKNKQGIKDFKVKHNKYFWQYKFLGYLIDRSKFDGDGRAHFIRHGDELVQISQELAVARIDENNNEIRLLHSPISVDLKNTVATNMTMAKSLLNKEKLTAYAIGIIAFVIMAVVQIAFLYFTRKR